MAKVHNIHLQNITYRRRRGGGRGHMPPKILEKFFGHMAKMQAS